jgi:hypothetical protein
MLPDKEIKMNTEEEKRNLEAVNNIVHLYNADLKRMWTDCFADECVFRAALQSQEWRGKAKELLIQEVQSFLDAYPDRRSKWVWSVAKDDIVVGQSEVTWTDEEKNVQTIQMCVIYKFKNGKVIEDTTYSL